MALSTYTHTHTHWKPLGVSAQSFGTFLMLNQKRLNERARREWGGRGSILGFPLQWKALFVEHSCAKLTPPPPQTSPPSYPPFIPLPSLPSKARADFSLNAIRNVTGPIHGQMEDWLCGWRPIPSLENDRNLGCRWRSAWIEQADCRGPERRGKRKKGASLICFFYYLLTFLFLRVSLCVRALCP